MVGGKTAQRSRVKHLRRGAAVVEFALVAPLFCLLLAGIIEFGQVFRVEHMLSNAGRRGARSAVAQGVTTSQVQKKIKNHCVQTLGVNEGDVTVAVAVDGDVDTDLSQAEAGAEINVTVSVPYSKVGIGFYATVFSTATLSSTCTLEHE